MNWLDKIKKAIFGTEELNNKKEMDNLPERGIGSEPSSQRTNISKRKIFKSKIKAPKTEKEAEQLIEEILKRK